MTARLPFDDGSVLSAFSRLSEAGERLAMLRRQESGDLERLRQRDRARQEQAWAKDEGEVG